MKDITNRELAEKLEQQFKELKLHIDANKKNDKSYFIIKQGEHPPSILGAIDEKDMLKQAADLVNNEDYDEKELYRLMIDWYKKSLEFGSFMGFNLESHNSS